MAYNLIYIEDLNPGSIISDLNDNGFEVAHLEPGMFEKLINDINELKFDGILLDFRLTQGSQNAVFDAPTIAQTLRTKSANSNNHFPIFLISSESIISSYYQDFTSNDLFDFSVEKEVFQGNLEKYSGRLKDFIEGYRRIAVQNYDLSYILGISSDKLESLDYRFTEKFNDPYLKTNSYKISRLINNTLIRSIGTLVGEEMLSSKLGVKIQSEGWEILKKAFSDAKYNGIFCGSYNRWWSTDIEQICQKKFMINNIRRLKAQQRVEAFENVGFTGLEALEKIQFAESTNFWTICKDLHVAIDPIDGLELISKEIIPWQDKEYISILAAMQSSDYIKSVKPIEIERFHEFVKSLNK